MEDRPQMEPLRLLSRWFGLLLLLLTLAACATGAGNVVDHAFSFDMLADSPDVRILDYRYGNSEIFANRAAAADVARDTVRQSANVNGEMLRGDFLYVKWRIKSTGQVYEDTVDLRDRLPRNLKGYRIHFVIRGPQLYVYLISPQKRDPNSLPGPLRMYSDRIVTTIYPDQPQQH